MPRFNRTALNVSTTTIVLGCLLTLTPFVSAQKYSTPDGKLRVALVKQPFSPNGISAGPNTMANGGIQPILAGVRQEVGRPRSGQLCWHASNAGLYENRGVSSDAI